MAYGPECTFFANTNYAVCQSSNGYLWFGTQNGLVRFDGKRYRNYFSDYANPNSPSDNTIVDITEDKRGNLWMAGYFHGVTRYELKTGRFTKYSKPTDDRNNFYGVNRILCAGDGSTWLCTAGRGLARYDYDRDNFSLYFPEPGKSRDGAVPGDNSITDVCEDPADKNMLWCTTFHGLFSFNRATETFTHYPSPLLDAANQDVLQQAIEAVAPNTLWIGTYGKRLISFNTRTHVFNAPVSKGPAIANDIKKVSDSVLYIAALDEGLFSYNMRTGVFANITPPVNAGREQQNHPGIQRISITASAGVFAGGYYYFYQQHPAFTRLAKNITYTDAGTAGRPDILLGNIIWDAHRNRYWVATYFGSGVYYLLPGAAKAVPVGFTSPVNDPSNSFKQVCIDKQNRVWALKRQHRLFLWNDARNLFEDNEAALPLPGSLKNNITAIRPDHSGNLWLVAGMNFYYWDVTTNTIAQFPVNFDPAYKAIKRTDEQQLICDTAGNAWLLTYSGMFYCNRPAKTVTHIFRTGNHEDSLSATTIIAGTFNTYNNLWFATGSQLQVMDAASFRILANHDVQNGLPSMAVNALNTDNQGRIWTNTPAGLAMFNPKAKFWRNYNRYDGMERDLLDGETVITANQHIAIDQVNGFIFRNIDEIAVTGKPPELKITGMLINDEEVADSLLVRDGGRLYLPYSKNNITIDFAAMDWLYPFKTTYAYKIDEDNFGQHDGDGRLRLTGLSPGKYEVHVKAINNGGEWSNEIVFTIIIRSPFWSTWWFIALCCLVVMGVMYLLYRYRIRQLKQLHEMRNSISSNLHDDIGASLSNIHILNELAKRNTGNAEKVIGYLDKAGEDIQRISESLSDIVWNINPRYDQFENLLIRMKRYAAEMMDGRNISYTINFPPDADMIRLNMDKRRDLYLIFKEAVNNLVKYSGAAEAQVSLSISSRILTLVISDNGCGFDPVKVKEGNGLTNMRQRAAKWKGMLQVDSTAGKGTQIELKLPL